MLEQNYCQCGLFYWSSNARCLDVSEKSGKSQRILKFLMSGNPDCSIALTSWKYNLYGPNPKMAARVVIFFCLN